MYKSDGSKYIMVEKRERWVNYLQGHKVRTDEFYFTAKKTSSIMTQTVKEEI